MVISERIKELRKKRGYTAQYMADNINTSLRNYRKYESGDTNPTLEGLVCIANLLDVSTDYLLGRDDFIKQHGIFLDKS